MVIFPKTYEKYQELLTSNEPVIVEGFTKLEESPRKFFPESIKKLHDRIEDQVSAVNFHINMENVNERDLEKFHNILLTHRGSVAAHIIFEHKNGKAFMPLGQHFLLNPTPRMGHKS